MEYKAREVKSGKHSSLPSPCQPQSTPWLVFHHGSDLEKQTLFSPWEERYHIRSIPCLRGKRCRGISHGWLFLEDVGSKECCAVNPTSLEKIQLPQVEMDKGAEFGFVMTSPPSHPKCLVILYASEVASFQYCRPGDSKFTKVGYKLKGDYNDIEHMTCYDGVLYAITTQQMLARVDVVSSTPTLRLTKAEPVPYCEGYQGSYSTLVESCGDLYLVRCIFFGSTVVFKDLDVFRMDFSEMAWERMKSLGGRLFFTSFHCSFSCARPQSTSIKGDCILFTDGSDSRLYTYDMEEDSFAVDYPCPNIAPRPRLPPAYWVMLPSI